MTTSAKKPVSELLKHRGGIPTVVKNIYPEEKLFKKLGGRSTIKKIINELYDRIEKDSSLRPMFSGDLSKEREAQVAFFEEWSGGKPVYTRDYVYNGMRDRHAHIHITKESAFRWLGHMKEAVNLAVEDKKTASQFMQSLTPIAMALVNEKKPLEGNKGHRCVRLNPWRELNEYAAKGRLNDIKHLCGKHEELLENVPGKAPTLVWHAAKGGHLDIVKFLVGKGVDVNSPQSIRWSILVTPYCIAKARKKDEIVEYLLKKGAIDDIFTCAYLGDQEKAAQYLAKDPDIVNATDPACDYLPITPLHHAVMRGKVPMVKWLLENGAKPNEYSTALVEEAAEKERIPLVKLLLEHGADATRIGHGKWVKNNELASLLTEHGAGIDNDDGDWIWFACTGNHGLRDDPALIEGLLKYGADVKALYRGATALHFSTRAGFPESMKVLIKNGADVNAQDEEGETPLFYAFKAKNKNDIKQPIQVLLKHGADKNHKNKKGETVVEVAKLCKRDDRDVLVKTLLK